MLTLKKITTLLFLGFFLLCTVRSPVEQPVTAAAATTTAITAQQQPSPEGVEFFEKKIRPVLAAQCYTCHSTQTKKPQGGLLLDTREGTLKGGDSGLPSIVPGDPEKSLLIKAIRHTDSKLQMPMGEQLPLEQIKDFEAWVKMGAPDPRTSTVAATATAPLSAYDFDEARKFWSFQPIKDAAPPPQVKNSAWIKSPIDQFILAKLEEKRLMPVADADKRTLIRRATFDLTGLPPTPEEVEAFLHDKSDKAFEKVVDRLLASPHYGERWGRHWLDVVRYADTAGDNSDFPVPSAYRYRNYVIKSFNDDKPYNEFVREQIAGDLLPSTTPDEKRDRIIATGYLALSRRFGSRNNETHLTIDDTIDNVGRSVLGLSISCARCHDHKFDPIPTKDYYALYGIFNSTKYAFPGTEIYRHTNDFVPLAKGDEAAKLIKWQTELAELDDRVENLGIERGKLERKAKAAKADSEKKSDAEKKPADDAKEAKDGASIVKTVANLLNQTNQPGQANQPRQNTQAAQATPSPSMPPVGSDVAGERTVAQVKAELAEVKARIAELENQALTVDKAFAVSEGKAANSKVFRKGEPKNLGEEAPRGFLQVLGGQRLPDTAQSGSGRNELAAWLTDSKSPLTARVMVNRIWQHHFGKGLVQTPNDFGIRGKLPTHPELLDYLATRFIESKWSMKTMHRLMMLSHTYQIASVDNPHNAGVDVSNDLLWRFNRRRLDAEEIRDGMLLISGALDRTMGGAHPFPPEKEWRYTQHKPFVANVANYDTDRRSIYLMQQRIKKHPFMEVFDGADTNATTAERPISVTPIQALFMMNDSFVYKQADTFAVRVGMAYTEEPKRIDYAHRLAFGRLPTKEEIGIGIDYLRQSREHMKEAGVAEEAQARAALASYFRVLLSSSEFLFVD